MTGIFNGGEHVLVRLQKDPDMFGHYVEVSEVRDEMPPSRQTRPRGFL